MAHKFTRCELYELVWSEPMKSLAARYGLSDVGLAKACRRHDIPRPERGHWAKLAAGKKVTKRLLPLRGPGMSDEVVVGAGIGGWRSSYLSDEEILAAKPSPPVFDRDIEDIACDIRKAVGTVRVPKAIRRPHRLIAKLLADDEERRQKAASDTYAFSWNQPLFDSPFEKRRLRLLNTIFTELERHGMKPWVRGKEARELSVQVNSQNVNFFLDDANVKKGRHPSEYERPRNASGRMKLTIQWWGLPEEVCHKWEDNKNSLIENSITEIVNELILAGERHYRADAQRHYTWMVERRSQILEEARCKREEAERKERERLARLEQERIGRLLDDANALRQAHDIRAYVQEVKDLLSSNENAAASEGLETWSVWALTQADRIDPVASGKFRESMKDTAEKLE